MLTVLTLDLAKGIEPVDSVAVMTDGRIVYASPQSLYVATEQWAVRPEPARPTAQKSDAATAIHKFDISNPVRTQYRGSGSVPGYLLSQWSLSEYRGVLRVVSTETPAWWGPGGESESFLTTMRERDGALVQAGRERRVPGGTGLEEPQLRAEAEDQRDIGGGELAPTDRVGRPLAVPAVAAYVETKARVRRP